MSKDELRLLWTQKITSYDKFREVNNQTENEDVYPEISPGDILPRPGPDASANLGNLEHTDTATTWWLRREIMREQLGVYGPPSAVLEGLRVRSMGFGVYWPHVSKDDPTMVAYTPDQQAGLNDKQVKVALGRLLRRWFPTAPDHVIARLEASHRADLDPTFPVARTTDEIENVYLHMDGDSGCMRYGRGHFNLTSAHPSHVYSSPGFGVAYQERDGEIVSRAVIWDNPDNPEDKRYVRIYGDNVLKRKLERSGYRVSGLAGARLAVVKDDGWDEDDSPITIVMPYLDPAGGIHSGLNGPRFMNAAHGVLFEGEDTVLLLGDDDANRYRIAGANVFGLRSQSGTVQAPRTQQGLFEFTDLLTGLTHNKLTVTAINYCAADGRLGKAAMDSLPIEERSHRLTAYANGSLEHFFCSGETYARFQAAESGVGAGVYDNAETLKAMSICRLDAEMYPGHALVPTSETRVVYRSFADASEAFSAWEAACATASGVVSLRQPEMRVPRAEVVQVRRNDQGSFYVHISATPELKKAGHVPIGVVNNIRQMAHKSNPNLAITVSGRRVLRGVHDVTILLDGRFEFERNCTHLNLFGQGTWASKNDEWEAVTLSDKWFKDNTVLLDWEVYSVARRTEHFLANASAKVAGTTVAQFVDANGNLRVVTYYDKPTTPLQLVEGARRLLAAHEANPETFISEQMYPKKSLFWARNVVALWNAFEAANAEQAARDAAPATPEAPAPVDDIAALAADIDTMLETNEWVPEPVPAPPPEVISVSEWDQVTPAN